MTEQLDPKDLVSFKEFLIANSIQADAFSQLLTEKGFIKKQEYFSNMRVV